MGLREWRVSTPLSEETVRGMRVGDLVWLSGRVVTARDQAHRRALDLASSGGELPVDLSGIAVYHCGPIARREGEVWRIYGFGPTTSARMEPMEAEFLRTFGVRMIVGKGGMGGRTADALAEVGAVYAAFTGGASVLATDSVERVISVNWLDLGIPEALWEVEVRDLGPLIVAMDSVGGNLYREVASHAAERMGRLLG